MSMRSINTKWIDKIRLEIKAHKEAIACVQVPAPIDVTTSVNMCIQWLVMELAGAGLPFKLIQLGAGVKRVTTLVDVCSKCNGTGKC